MRKGGRCPSQIFLRGLEKKWADKFRGSFYGLTIKGKDYYNPQRFKPLIKLGKPLWEFKEFSYRLYCIRIVDGNRADVILLNGWSKDKEGQSKEEDRQIETALSLLEEYSTEAKGRTK